MRYALKAAGLLVGLAAAVVPIAVIPAAAQTVGGAIIYVDADATGAETGQSWDDAFTDLQDALAVAQDGDEVWVAEGMYTPTDGTDRTISFVLTSGVALYGGFNGTEQARDERDWTEHETILSGEIGDPEDEDDNSYHVVTASGSGTSTVFDGFVVERGRANSPDPHDRGAGLYAVDGDLTIRNATFRLNRASGAGLAQIGGGIYTEGGSPLVEDCLFEENVGIGAFHAAGGTSSSGNPVVRRSVFTENVGGGVAFTEGAGGLVEDVLIEGDTYRGSYVSGIGTAPVFRRVTFRGNESPSGDGGGASIRVGAAPLFQDCLFEGNHAFASGAAAFAEGGAAPVFLGTTFRQNAVGGSGGAVYIKGNSDALFLGCTFVRNRAGGSGAGSAGGLYLESGGTVVNSVFYGNSTASQISGGGGLTLGGTPPGESVLVANVALVGNRALEGGAVRLILTSGADVRLVNIVAAANEATGQGGSVWAFEAEGTRIENAILWGNVSPGGEQIYVSQGAGPLVRRSLIEGGYDPGTEILDANPLFVRNPHPGADGQWGTEDDDYGDLRLLEGSPAVDFGLAEYLPADRWDLDGDGDTDEPLPVDLAGNPRVIGEAPDLGAYEGAVIVSNEPVEPPAEDQSLRVWPNPVSTTLHVEAPGAEEAVVYDVLGREVLRVRLDGVTEGESLPRRVGVSGLAPGVYVVRAGGQSAVVTVRR